MSQQLLSVWVASKHLRVGDTLHSSHGTYTLAEIRSAGEYGVTFVAEGDTHPRVLLDPHHRVGVLVDLLQFRPAFLRDVPPGSIIRRGDGVARVSRDNDRWPSAWEWIEQCGKEVRECGTQDGLTIVDVLEGSSDQPA